MLTISPIIVILIVTNVLTSLKGFKNYSFFNRYKFQISSIQKGEFIRIFSSGFLHVDTAHLLLNMITLYFFAGEVLSQGVIFFLGIYFASLLAGNVFALYFHRKDPFYSAVGASGAVMGVLFAAILIHPEISVIMFFIPIPIPGYIFAALYLGYTLYGMKKQSDTIGHTAHFGGVLGGIILTLLNFPRLVLTSQKTLLFLTVTILVVGLVLFRKKK